MMKRLFGFATFELAVVATVVSVVGAAVYVEAMQDLETAERMRMETQARSIGNALQLRMSKLIGERREGEIVELIRANPVQWLPAQPENYVGERDRPPAKGEALESWYFDASRGELVYRVRRGSRFLPDSGGERQVRFKAELVQDESGDRWKIAGAVFRPVEPYRWR